MHDDSFGMYYEVLSMDGFDSTFLNSSRAPLLWMHDTCEQIGVIESCRVDNDRVARAVVRMSKNGDNLEYLQDVRDGIIQNVSVGYTVHAYENTNKQIDGIPILVATNWVRS